MKGDVLVDTFIYHITEQEQWGQACLDGEFTDESLDYDGFIHCCYGIQLKYIADRYFKGKENLLVLEITRKSIKCKVKDEEMGKEQYVFPHVYGPIPVNAVRKAAPLHWDKKKKAFEKPEGLKINLSPK